MLCIQIPNCHNRPWLTSDDQLGGGCDIVDGCLRRAGVAPGVLQLGVLDKQRAVGAAVLHKAAQQTLKIIVFVRPKLTKAEI